MLPKLHTNSIGKYIKFIKYKLFSHIKFLGQDSIIKEAQNI